MLTSFYKLRTSTFQFALLALTFGLPLFYNQALDVISQKQLTDILVLEFGVLLYGFFIAGFFLIPLVAVDNIWFRRACLIFAFLFAINISSSYSDDESFHGTLIFLWLFFVNFGAVFTAHINHKKRGGLAVEVGLRNMVYLIIFLMIVLILDMPTNIVDRWNNNENTLLFGFIYFSIFTYIEFNGYFAKTSNAIYHYLNSTYVQLPKSKVKYKNGKLKHHVIKHATVHCWWVFFLAGTAITTFTSAISYGIIANEESSWALIIGVGFLLLMFLLFGLESLYITLIFIYKHFTAKPILLTFDKNSLKHGNELIAKGYIPKYLDTETRKGIELELICYKITSPTSDDEMPKVKKTIDTIIAEHVTKKSSDTGTQFSFSCKIPPLNNKKKKDRIYYICHLQVNITDLNAKEEDQHWAVAFTLPINHPVKT